MRIFLQLIMNALCESATEFEDKGYFVEMATFLGTDLFMTHQPSYKRVGVSAPSQE